MRSSLDVDEYVACPSHGMCHEIESFASVGKARRDADRASERGDVFPPNGGVGCAAGSRASSHAR